ncbi:DNA replication initiation control protein YabA [Aerococcus kribbianus]|uniref:DNA replication initiation control protein YabA n=1 Tax=Aerococcus kribbianus TaxID=2999064 RepID=A0A9X3JFQ0_9LACT|nr:MULTISPECIES: DNA replication initiation control protein YabA [unclassified Aerococcus]MCZ0717904.1 DNA replication initiation control protein YabA [Aerococcus sp. YH-aer221]MCZ0726191.1 DNA replication initiation control protein YabA [Aerococcus sp. YH-aer222]
MDKREMTDKLLAMQEQLAQMSQEVESLSREWDELLVNSHNLEMENHYLRERINAYSSAYQDGQDSANHNATQASHDLGLSKARQNLMHIYEDGFHICNISYGQRRENDEQCMFCLDILYGNKEGDK